MPVCKRKDNDMGGGEHWSLLVYKKDENKWYYFDSINTYNDIVARNLVDSVNKYTVRKQTRFCGGKLYPTK